MPASLRPAVVVLAYDRPATLRRLLASLARASYPDGGVPLVLSIDRSDTPAGRETLSVARDFPWPHGPRTVIEREQRLGVVGHFRAAGALTAQYRGIVLLEDDLVVAPSYYDFARAVLDAYCDERIAGCCLYGLWFNGFTHLPFMPLADGSDIFFAGAPYTQGLCFSDAQWQAFDAWSREGRVEAHPALHPAFLRFGADEWFPTLAAYMARTGRYFVYPRVSQTAGWGDAGAHFAERTSWFQTPLQVASRGFRTPPLDDAIAVYDGFFELLPDRLRALAPALAAHEFDVDLSATKLPQNLRSEHVLTTRPVRRALARFGLEMYPPELNLAYGVPGSDISLARAADVYWDGQSEDDARQRLQRYQDRLRRASRRRALRFAVASAVTGLRGLRDRLQPR